MRALITGSTGFIGRRLTAALANPVVLTRDPAKAARVLGGVEAYRWEPIVGFPPREAFRGVDVVFNLMGEPIAQGRWNHEKRRRIRESRVVGTRNLVAGIASLPERERPKVLVSASAVGYYGNRRDEILDESSSPGDDFLASVCQDWEAEARKATALGVRVVTIRHGIVLRRDGGALAQMLPPFRLGLGGRLGSGTQWMSWIHLDDLVSLHQLAANKPDLKGAVNGVAPLPVTNAEFTRVLARVLNRPAVLPVPALAIRAVFGGVAEVMLGSQRVLPRAAGLAGAMFAYPDLESCLKAALAG